MSAEWTKCFLLRSCLTVANVLERERERERERGGGGERWQRNTERVGDRQRERGREKERLRERQGERFRGR